MYALSMSPALAVSIAREQTLAAMQAGRRSRQARATRSAWERARRPARRTLRRPWLLALHGRAA